MRHLGFTGTRQGLTDKQMDSVTSWFLSEDLTSSFTGLLHGCAIGADCWVARLINGQSRYIPIYAYPCNISSQISKEAIAISDSVYESSPPLERNKTIVDYCDVLLACPAKMHEEQRSGTWATIRYARRRDKPIVIAWPDGSITKERA